MAVAAPARQQRDPLAVPSLPGRLYGLSTQPFGQRPGQPPTLIESGDYVGNRVQLRILQATSNRFSLHQFRDHAGSVCRPVAIGLGSSQRPRGPNPQFPANPAVRQVLAQSLPLFCGWVRSIIPAILKQVKVEADSLPVPLDLGQWAHCERCPKGGSRVC